MCLALLGRAFLVLTRHRLQKAIGSSMYSPDRRLRASWIFGRLLRSFKANRLRLTFCFQLAGRALIMEPVALCTKYCIFTQVRLITPDMRIISLCPLRFCFWLASYESIFGILAACQQNKAFATIKNCLFSADPVEPLPTLSFSRLHSMFDRCR